MSSVGVTFANCVLGLRLAPALQIDKAKVVPVFTPILVKIEEHIRKLQGILKRRRKNAAPFVLYGWNIPSKSRSSVVPVAARQPQPPVGVQLKTDVFKDVVVAAFIAERKIGYFNNGHGHAFYTKKWLRETAPTAKNAHHTRR